MKRIGVLLILMLALATILFCSCGKEQGGNTDTGNDDNLQTIETVDESDAIDLSNYIIIRSDSGSQIEKDAAVALRMAIQEKCGFLPDLKTDFSGGGDLEIVVGDTKRGGADDLNKAQYVIKHTEKGFLIAGGSDIATSVAVDFFIENLLSPSGVLCKSGFEYKVDNSLKLGDKTYDEVNIFVEFTIDTCSAEIIETFTKLGVPASVCKKAEAANILLTTDPDIKVDTIPEGSWGVTVQNGILYIVGRDEYDAASACSYVSEYFGGVNGRISIKDGVLTMAEKLSKEDFYAQKNLTIYPEFPERIRRDYMYSVSVTQGDKTATLPVYNHCQPGVRYTRDNIGGDNYRRFSIFAFSGEQVRVDVKVGRNFDTYSVLPSAKEFKSEYKDGTISVYLDKPEYFMIRLDDDNNTVLSILADYPEYPLDIPSKDDPDVTWISGVVEPEDGVLIYEEDNKTVYIEPGAVLFARIKLAGKNCKILGRGAMVDPFENFYKFNPEGQSESKGIKFVYISGQNCLFDGPVLLDAHCYNFNVQNYATIRNAKALSVMITTDGLQLSKFSKAERCFMYVGDNGTVFSGEGVEYKDITIGTTCAAIFPQGETKNCKMEDIYVFRSDGGLINNRYNGSSDTPPERVHQLDITGLYADDCTTLPWFFQGQNMGSLEKVFNITNATSCGTTGVETIYNDHTGTFIRFDTTEGKIYTDNYTLNIKNLYIDGRLITSLDDINVQETRGSGKTPSNTINIEYDDTKVVSRVNNDARYMKAVSVYIGARQIFLRDSAIIEGDKVYLPAQEIQTYLRKTGNVKTTEKNGVAYAEADDIVSAGLAESAQKTGNSVTFTPVYNGENLLLPDTGDIPYYIESIAYLVEMIANEVDDEVIYSIFNIRKSGAGMQRELTDEVKMYGNGKYVLEFEISGNGPAEVRTFLETAATTSNQRQNIVLNGGWQKVRFEVPVNFDLTDFKAFSFRVGAASDTGLSSFDIKNIKFTKEE